MEHQNFEQLVTKIRSCYFSSSKRDAINKSLGALTAQQIYRLQGQFTSGSSRVQLVLDLQTATRILPMTAAAAEPVIKMGIYSGQRKQLYQTLIPFIADRQVPESRYLLLRNFPGFDHQWATRELDQAGPYEGPAPVSTIFGPGTVMINHNALAANQRGRNVLQYPLSSIYDGLLTAHVPGQESGVTSAVPFQGHVPQAQPLYYPSVPSAVNVQYQPHALYPPPPSQGYGSAPPPYASVDVGAYPQPPQQQSTCAPNIATGYLPPSATSQPCEAPSLQEKAGLA